MKTVFATLLAALLAGCAAHSPPSSGKMVEARYLTGSMPVYPVISRRLGEEGTTILTVWISAKGAVVKMGIYKSSGYPRLDKAALTAVKDWKFAPRTYDGVAVDSTSRLPIMWKLEEDSLPPFLRRPQ